MSETARVDNGSGSPVVLVLEYHPALRDVLLDALGWEGLQVVTARTDGDAARMLEDGAVHLVVADPSSYDYVEQAEQQISELESRYSDVQVVVLAQDTDEPVHFRPWTTAGRRRTLRRPFRLSDLIAACREALDEILSQNGAPSDADAVDEEAGAERPQK